MKILILKCRFCDKITGEYKYPDNLTVADLGIADTRCEICEGKYGSFKEMSDEFTRDCGTYDEFKTVIAKSEYKRAKFDLEVAKIKNEALKLGSKLKSKSKKSIIK